MSRAGQPQPIFTGFLLSYSISQMDYYSILEVESSANENEIKKSYRKLALRWHPDKNSSPEAAEKFKEICALIDNLLAKRTKYCRTYQNTKTTPIAAEKRRLYDKRGSKPSSSKKNYQESFMRGHDPFTGFHASVVTLALTFHTPEQVFASFFGGRDPFAEMFGPNQFMPQMRPSFGGSSVFGGDPFDDPFFNQPFGGMRAVPGGFAGSSFSMSTSSSSGGMMSSRSKSVSRTTRVINGRPQTVTVTKISDEQGTRTIEDYGNGQQRVLVNGVEQRNDIEGGNSQGYLPQPNEDPSQYNSPYGMQQQQQQQQQYPPMYYQRQPSFWDRW
ncbi:hypothetical protein NQZ79_g3522 [Umbelopsis isabellina]|nr:hypothetical protein NQZ79_g3522 [Umbelopsis isabellina]